MLLKFKDDKDGGSLEGELDLSPGRSRFNPMQSWMKAGKILSNTVWGDMPSYDSMINGSEPQQQGMSPEDYGVTQQVQDQSGVPSIPKQYQDMNYGQPQDYGVDPTTQYHPPGAMQQMSHMPDQQGIDPTSLAMQNMPYDFTGAMPNAFEGTPPPTTGYGTPNAGGGLQEPSANFPPPGYPSNVPTPDGQTFT